MSRGRGAPRTLAALAVAWLVAGCATTSEQPSTPARQAPTAVATVIPGGVTAFPVPPRSPLDGPYPRYRDAANGLVTVLGTPDLAPGPQRVSFVLSDAEGVVRLPVVQFELYRFASGREGPSGPVVASGTATFHPFPADTRGLHTTRVDFPEAGTWGLRLIVPRPDGTVASTLFAFDVPARARAPLVGDAAPRSLNRTLASTSLAELSTGSNPDPAVYGSTIAAALDASRPFVVVFASPGFCTNALCGPQVEQLSELRALYEERAAFIHVELYENPQAVRQQGLQVGVRTPVLGEWGLETDEWTFVVDGSGSVAARFEGFAPREEVEAALRGVLSR
ncbi:MAG: hypothetical protein IT299_10930 [Dehalococcoidia bacterium]|nr:hypothetical protein [Dehalococcoidia bacterium]